MGWTAVFKTKPAAIMGEAGKPPIISDDVLCYWDEHQPMEVGNYDHEEDAWFSSATGNQWDQEPSFWLALPPPPSNLGVPETGEPKHG
jgi:hypothetical protein